jgi:hypothetical protein
LATYDVTDWVRQEDERIRKLQEAMDREREAQWSKADRIQAEQERVRARAESLGIWDRCRKRVKTKTIGKTLSAVDRERAKQEASELWDDIMQVYRDGLTSEDYKHRKACADALKEMILGKAATAPPPLDENRSKVLVVNSLDELSPEANYDDDEED